MTTSNVISFLEKKKIKDRENRNKLTMPIYDLYISYNEIPFWKQVIKHMQEINWKQEFNYNVEEVEEFVTAFELDMEMYREFGKKEWGKTLEKFRFLFSHLELYSLYKMMLQINDTEHEEVLKHYKTFLARMLKENSELSRLIQ